MKMANTLSYSRLLPADQESLYDRICAAQLAYFRQYSPKIRDLAEGMQITRDFCTKINAQKIPGKSILASLQKEKIVLRHVYGGGRIEGAWILEPVQGQTRLTYQETSTFLDPLKQKNFLLVSFFYRFLFCRQTKKRFRWLLEQCQETA